MIRRNCCAPHVLADACQEKTGAQETSAHRFDSILETDKLLFSLGKIPRLFLTRNFPGIQH
jgi:hypothetical protein